jgi:hypothetical protein
MLRLGWITGTLTIQDMVKMNKTMGYGGKNQEQLTTPKTRIKEISHQDLEKLLLIITNITLLLVTNHQALVKIRKLLDSPNLKSIYLKSKQIIANQMLRMFKESSNSIKLLKF